MWLILIPRIRDYTSGIFNQVLKTQNSKLGFVVTVCQCSFKETPRCAGQKEQGIVPFVSHLWCMFHSVWQIWRQYICQQCSIRTKSQHTNIWGFGVNNELRKFHILRKAGHTQYSDQLSIYTWDDIEVRKLKTMSTVGAAYSAVLPPSLYLYFYQ